MISRLGRTELYTSPNVLGTEIFRLKPGAKDLGVFAQDDRLKGGPDGIDFGADGALYLDTYGSGQLFRIELDNGQAGKITEITPSRKLTHPDGLRAFRSGFLMVEGGGTLDRVTISGENAKIDTIKAFKGPTGVTIVGDQVWVSEGQFSYLSDPSKKGTKPENFQLRSAPLPEN